RRSEDASIVPDTVGLISPPMVKAIASGKVDAFQISIECRAGKRRANGDIVCKRRSRMPSQGASFTPIMSGLTARGVKHLEVTMQVAISTFHEIAVVKAAFEPRIRVGIMNTVLGIIIALHFAIPNTEVSADAAPGLSPGSSPGVLANPAAVGIVVAN